MSLGSNVLEFPTPRATQATIQPSVHARGARPYTFIHRVDPWHAPGLERSGEGCHIAADGAWILQSIIGPPYKPPALWPGLPQARKAAEELGPDVGLYPFQAEGAAFLAERDYAILADATGIGKTGQALVAAEARLQSTASIPNDSQPVVLILCPALAKRHWMREVKKWTGHEAVILDGMSPLETWVTEAVHNCVENAPKGFKSKLVFDDAAEKRFYEIVQATFPRIQLRPEILEGSSGERLAAEIGQAAHAMGYSVSHVPLPQGYRYVIANYDIIRALRKRDGAGVFQTSTKFTGWGQTLAGKFLIAIVDEAHELRGRKSQKAKAIRDMLRRVPVVWSLTATPMPNYVRDLWGLVDTTTAGLWGQSYWNWAKRYCEAREGKYGWVDTGADYLDELQKRLGFFMLGRSKNAVALELPEKRREIYEVDVDMTAPTVNEAHAAKQRFRQVAKSLRATARAKRPAVIAQALEALKSGQKVVIGVYLRETAEKIAQGISKDFDGQVICVHGDQTPEQRDVLATTFRDNQGACAFVATIDSVGLTISLVGADLTIVGDLIHQPHKLLQFEGRVHRHGSERRVLIRYVIAAGTIDEAVAETVLSKLKNIEEAVGREEEGGGLASMLKPDPAEEQAVVDRLFDKLVAWGKK